MNISIDALRKYVEKIAKRVLDDETNKPVVVGTVMSSLPGCYEVQLVNGNQTSLVRAQSLYSDKVFAVNDSVYLVKAESNRGDNYETNYFIVGLVTTIEQNFANLTEWERFLGDGQKIYPKLNENIVEVSFDKNINDDPDTKDVNEANNFTNFLNAVRANGVFLFSTDVTTNISDPGNFGLTFEFTFDDKPIKEEKFPGITFVGQPWSLKDVTQKKIFDLGTQNNLKSIRIIKTDPTDGSFDVSNISLESGTFLDLVNDFKVTLENVNGKNYLNKSADNGVVQIKANVNYGNQKLDTKALKYYWFVKREGATHINSLGGSGWECLNDFSSAQYIDENNSVQEKKDVLIYKTDDNILEINYESANTKNWLPQYENEIKCVVGYQLANATSNPIKVYNFNKESYNITIEKTSGESPILYKDEYITLEAKYTSKTINPTGISTFKWYKKGDSNPLTYKDKSDVDQPYTSNKINIYGQNSNKNNTESDYVMKDELEEFYCIAYIGENAINTESETNSIIISSKTMLATQLIEQSNFKYWIDTKSNLRFVSKTKTEEIKEDNTTGGTTFEDSYIYYTTESGVEGINPGVSKLNELKEKNEIFEEYTTGKYYLYYTEQKIVVDENKNNVYRYNDYSYPKILRCVFVSNDGKVTDVQSTGSIEKLNTFNDLTDGGRAQGIEYEDATYSKTTVFDENKLNTGKGYYKKVDTYEYKSVGKLQNFKDEIVYYYKESDKYIQETETTPVVDREYYIYELVKTDYVLRTQNSDNYILDTNRKPSGFKDGEEYYEQNGGDLYINASFIRSGHLEVGNGEKTVFSADLDNKTVTIGGFHVMGDHLASGVPSATDPHLVLVSPGYKKDENGVGFVFWAGAISEGRTEDYDRPFWVKNDGTLKANKGTISSWEMSEDGLFTKFGKSTLGFYPHANEKMCFNKTASYYAIATIVEDSKDWFLKRVEVKICTFDQTSEDLTLLKLIEDKECTICFHSKGKSLLSQKVVLQKENSIFKFEFFLNEVDDTQFDTISVSFLDNSGKINEKEEFEQSYIPFYLDNTGKLYSNKVKIDGGELGLWKFSNNGLFCDFNPESEEDTSLLRVVSEKKKYFITISESLKRTSEYDFGKLKITVALKDAAGNPAKYPEKVVIPVFVKEPGKNIQEIEFELDGKSSLAQEIELQEQIFIDYSSKEISYDETENGEVVVSGKYYASCDLSSLNVTLPNTDHIISGNPITISGVLEAWFEGEDLGGNYLDYKDASPSAIPVTFTINFYGETYSKEITLPANTLSMNFNVDIPTNIGQLVGTYLNNKVLEYSLKTFNLGNNGSLFAKTIEVESGKIGAFTIDNNGNIFSKNNFFKVSSSGEFYATKGKIGPLTIEGNVLSFSQNGITYTKIQGGSIIFLKDDDNVNEKDYLNKGDKKAELNSDGITIYSRTTKNGDLQKITKKWIDLKDQNSDWSDPFDKFPF